MCGVTPWADAVPLFAVAIAPPLASEDGGIPRSLVEAQRLERQARILEAQIRIHTAQQHIEASSEHQYKSDFSP